nr:nuclear transport factor 2 family protein [Allomuricauda sp.]
MRKLLFLLFLGTTPLLAQSRDVSDKKIAHELSEKYRMSVIKEDTLTLVKMLHPDVVFYPPKGSALKGSKNVGRVIKSFLSQNDVTAWDIEIQDVNATEQLFFEYGEFKIEENASVVSKRKYLNVWKLHNSEFKLFYRGWSPIE